MFIKFYIKEFNVAQLKHEGTLYRLKYNEQYQYGWIFILSWKLANLQTPRTGLTYISYFTLIYVNGLSNKNKVLSTFYVFNEVK